MRAVIIIDEECEGLHLLNDGYPFSCMLPIVDVSFLRYVIEYLKAYGVTEFEFIVSEEISETMTLLEKECEEVQFYLRTVHECPYFRLEEMYQFLIDSHTTQTSKKWLSQLVPWIAVEAKKEMEKLEAKRKHFSEEEYLYQKKALCSLVQRPEDLLSAF